MKDLAKVLLLVLAVLLLGSIACSKNPDPRDAAIERLNSRENQLIALLIQQNGDLKAERFALSTSLQESINAQMEMSNVTTVMTERYISHLEVEESQLRIVLYQSLLKKLLLKNCRGGRYFSCLSAKICLAKISNRVNCQRLFLLLT